MPKQHNDKVVEDRPTPIDPFLSFLQSIAGQHVHFFPKSGNAGDGFIAYATYELFKKYDITFTPHNQNDTVHGETVLIGGGGNLVEGRYTDVADLIRRHAANNQVVLLPHTIVGFADVLAETHRSLTVFCREPVSYRLALLNGANRSQTHLSHDVVFFLEDNHFKDFHEQGKGVLHALRQDGETAATVPLTKDNIDISLSWNGDLWTSPEFASHVTKSMAAYIAPYETIETDRLHVSILSAFLNKSVCLLPNVYFKNRAVFEHSIKSRFPRAEFINTLATLDESREPAPAAFIAGLGQELAEARETAEREIVLREAAERKLEFLLSKHSEPAEGNTVFEKPFPALLGEANSDSKLSAVDLRDSAPANSGAAEECALLREALEREIALREISDRRLELLQSERAKSLHGGVFPALGRTSDLEARLDEMQDELQWSRESLEREISLREAAERKLELIKQQEVERSSVEMTLDNALRECENLKNNLNDVMRSTSWRISAPIRVTKTRISGFRGLLRRLSR